jgi:hypothetical protein
MINIQEYIPLYSIFILLLILFGGYVAQLVPCKLQLILNNNVYIKHLFVFLTLVFLITLVDPNNSKNSLVTVLKRSILLYIFFILIIKTYYKIFIIIIVILGIKYLILLYKNELKDKLSDEKDPIKLNILNNKMNNIILIQNILFIIVIILLIIGVLIYYGEKKYEYKNKFNIITFLFGKPECSYTPEKISVSKALKYAFK